MTIQANEIKIAHLTSAHPRRDTRIFLKECKSLAKAGYETYLVVADGLGDALEDDVHVKDVGARSGRRLQRMLVSAYRVYKAARALDCDIYHLHDPELLPWALMLKLRGKRVIFDAHEDLAAQIMTKQYLPASLRRTVSVLTWAFERRAARRIDAIVAATPAIERKFGREAVSKVIALNNYPLQGELEAPLAGKRSGKAICYVGGISRIRGIVEVVRAMELAKSDARLKLAGGFVPESLRDEVAALSGWSSVDEYGFVGRAEVRDLMAGSIAGIVTFLPAPNHIDSQPNKMFEYMSAGLPVIASDFPAWNEIIAGNECGVQVDPENPQEIADAIDRLIGNPELARRYGENGSRAVREKYNWDIEEKKLLALYAEIATLAK